MYHVAICDDDKRFVSFMKRMLFLAKGEDSTNLNVYEFNSGEELIMTLDETLQFDLLILDMKLGGIDGDETARQFRKQFPDSVLVFCSGVRQPTIESFKTTPFRYIDKKCSNTELIKTLKEILDEVKRTQEIPYIIGHYRWTERKIKLKNILYIKTAKRGAQIVVCPGCKEAESEEKLLVNRKPDKLLEDLCKYGFALAQSSFLVNMDHIEKMGVDDFEFDSGENMRIARAYQKSFKEAFAKRFANKYI